MDDETECALNKLQTTKSVVDILKGRSAIQRELDKLDKCAARNLNFNKGKCKLTSSKMIMYSIQAS